MTTTENGVGLLRAICENHADDCLRLVYADWLDDCGEAERAEFVRVQIEIAATDMEREREFEPQSEAELSIVIRREERNRHRSALRRRERELLPNQRERFESEMARGVKLPSPEGTKLLFLLESAVFRRGFVDEVRCTPADWCGTGVCEGCYGQDNPPSYAGFANWRRSDCPNCAGTGRVGCHGPAIVAAQPVTRVVLTDREPNGPSSDGYHWFYMDQSVPHDVPKFLYELIKQKYGCDGIPFFRTKQAALAALSVACVSWARSLAGLPPLSPAAAG